MNRDQFVEFSMIRKAMNSEKKLKIAALKNQVKNFKMGWNLNGAIDQLKAILLGVLEVCELD